jgi:hypothetical protein
MLIYRLLGDEAQGSFARSWGVSYGVGAAAEWQARRPCVGIATWRLALRHSPPPPRCCRATGYRERGGAGHHHPRHSGALPSDAPRDVARGACAKELCVLRLHLMRALLLLTPLLLAQEHVDYLSVQALLFSSQLSRYQQARPPHALCPFTFA